MSTLRVVDPGRETLTAAVARRLRGQLAERQIRRGVLGDAMGLSHTSVLRRLNGETAINTDELEQICEVTGIDMMYLLTGRESRGPEGDDGVRHQGLEPRTRCLSVVPDLSVSPAQDGWSHGYAA